MTTVSRHTVPLDRVFPGDGEMARRCRAFDWTRTSLGPPSTWDAALRVAVRTALESPMPINLWCGADRVLIYNDGYIPLLGAKHPRALGTPGFEVWHEIWPEISGMFDRILAGGPATYAEDAPFRMERSGETDAASAWFTFSLSPVRDDAGEVIAFFNVAVESTQRILAQREVEAARAAAVRAEERLRGVFAQAPAFLAVLRGPEHVFEFANDAYLQLVGHRDIIGRRVVDAIPEVIGQGFVELLDRVLATGEPFVGRETPVLLRQTPDAPPTQLYLDFVYQPLVEGNGERVGIVAHGSNVTEAVMARRAIEASEARYRFLANAIPVQVWTATPDGALDFVSDRTARSLGRPAHALLGPGWLDVVHPDDVAAATERWQQSLRTGEPYEVEFRLRSAEHGAYRWHLGRAIAQRGDDGEVLAWFGTNTDIEESKRAQAELQRLTQEALDANRAKSDFLAAMSHDLRTPLNAIGGYAQLMEMGVRGPITDEQRTDLARIQRAKEHLDRLVSDVLSFAKLGAGRIDLRRHTVEARALVASVLEMIGPQLEEKRLELRAPDVPNGILIACDIDKTRQILVNLLANALKFTPAGGTIAIAVRAASAVVSIDVTDNGIGIPGDQLERIFQPFAQAERALDPREQGVGLGLAISRQLARAMAGELRVSSAPGVGSTFTLTLPRHAG
ncbi:PAS sensor protein [Gemmatirosa kalamazoonensis]|uniref:histidine kinase n=1 Tax=Gemmatirosa kalamazoonensis TaxID=861299 RepID=W0RNV9_9BACT|nr:ATP-binding protein [Gemmatirosa kalamazoonensis]AHG92040.1 PAS sensor protein [Gemmatirosa kalamazoonensis]